MSKVAFWIISEVNSILHTTGPQDPTPLFESYEEAHHYFKRGRLADEIRDQYKFWIAWQTRDLFKLFFPTRGQKARAPLIHSPQDLGRIALRHHGLAHWGSLYTNTVRANCYYTVNMYQTILDQIKGCSVCADFHKKKTYTALTNVLDLSSISQISSDLKGSLERAPTTSSKNSRKSVRWSAVPDAPV